MFSYGPNHQLSVSILLYKGQGCRDSTLMEEKWTRDAMVSFRPTLHAVKNLELLTI
jgi:hypothetical protein